MALNIDKDLKAYYNITEVAEMFGINATTLRFWEKQFPTLHPRTVGNNKRQYTRSDIDAIRIIHNLVKERGFKIEAAKKMIRLNPNGVDKTAQIIERLTNIRNELRDLKATLDKLS